MGETDRIAALEKRVSDLNAALRQVGVIDLQRSLELALGMAAALHDIAKTSGADLNGLILVLEKHLEIRRKSDPNGHFVAVEAVIRTLRLKAQ